MSVSEGIRGTKSLILLDSVENNPSKILSRMEYVSCELAQGERYDFRKRTETIILAELHVVF
jgi:hypothetical protein